MTRSRLLSLLVVCSGLLSCTTTSQKGTLAELKRVKPDVEELYLEDSLELAAQSYRRYLEETSDGARTPEAMRRLADLQLEQEYGVIGGGAAGMAAPESAGQPGPIVADESISASTEPLESDQDFEARASARENLFAAEPELDSLLPGQDVVPAGPREAISTYWKILETYPGYDRNDQVLYQLSRAYDEIGDPDNAMQVMDRLVKEYPRSKFVDEIHFRRGEYFFVRKKYLEAENAYASIIGMGDKISFYELALYKLGWTFYKQQFYEEALHNFVAMLDYRQSIGYDFDQHYQEDDEHRLADTFRVISLSFSNLGGPEVVDEYFSQYGDRLYADKIYSNLGEFYFSKRRFDDAASVYKSFIELNPFHKFSPHFSMRVVEIYAEAGFPQLVVEAKKEFATIYALDAEYWAHFDINDSPEVVALLKTNLTDLAGHYHALYQDEELLDERPASFSAANHWYRQFLTSFPSDDESPQINYRLAELLLENRDFSAAAAEYERTAYEYEAHEQNAAAGYAAVFAHRQNLEVATGAMRLEAMKATITSSLRFADAFQQHEQAPVVLDAAANDLYETDDFQRAIDSARKLIDRYPETDNALLRSAWAVIAHSSMDLAEYQDAELAYASVLDLTPGDDESRPAVIDSLAAAIYKQGEAANLMEDHQTAADHFLRIKSVAPDSVIRASAEYDAAAALMKLQDWNAASGVLEDFRSNHPDHELQSDATKQLAYLYHESGQIERSAAEHERIAGESADPELAREALLTAGELFDEVDRIDDAVRVYLRYVSAHPRPIDTAAETRSRLAEIFESQSDQEQYHAQLRELVALDKGAGPERTDRTRYLAARAALVIAKMDFVEFAGIKLSLPFEQSLARKQAGMDMAMNTFEALVEYQVAEVTAAATYYIAEIYLNFSNSLINSERPTDLGKAELLDYEMAIEEEAYPFEERAIGVHEENFELLVTGIHNDWVQNSLDKLAVLMPGRYAKNELSGGFVGSVDTYAYRMPIAPPVAMEEQPLEPAESAEPVEIPPPTLQTSDASISELNP